MRSEQKKVHVPLLTKLNNAKSWNDLKRSLDGSQKKKVFLKIRWYEQPELGLYTIQKTTELSWGYFTTHGLNKPKQKV